MVRPWVDAAAGSCHRLLVRRGVDPELLGSERERAPSWPDTASRAGEARGAPIIEVLHSAIDALERQEFPHGLSEDVGLPGLIQRAETHDIDLGQPVGHEPGFTRPAVVASVDMLNNGPGGLVVVVPLTFDGLRAATPDRE